MYFKKKACRSFVGANDNLDAKTLRLVPIYPLREKGGSATPRGSIRSDTTISMLPSKDTLEAFGTFLSMIMRKRTVLSLEMVPKGSTIRRVIEEDRLEEID
jgi:hypothetical protein